MSFGLGGFLYKRYMKETKKNTFEITSFSLKIIAAITMIIDHIAMVFLTPDSLLSNIMRFVGRSAFPIYAFLLIEGYTHTSNKMKYALRLFIFALISEPIYDLVKEGSALSHQNIFFTLFAGLVLIAAVDKMRNDDVTKILIVALVVIISGLAEMLCFGYGCFGILSIISGYYLYTKASKYKYDKSYTAITIPLIVMNIIELGTLLSLPFIHLYQGEQGRRSKWGFYLIYPVHLLILVAIKKFFL